MTYQNHIKLTLFNPHPIPAKPGQNLKKKSEITFLHIKNHRFLPQPYRPTGHCPNALVASSPPLDRRYMNAQIKYAKKSIYY